ncbi:putative bifunctional diguanylate cyclase/phosphodiesterase [Aureimonas psammosilenae]|uniref:putative bifunctional diguanylate cyclase/phosphodiesterase n=1 Tax=Aureimonas psammosilenae TaxID=2495496 RepID=UPI0022A6BB85|nr:EAL domain-containing protein [Aureimonas psammosilenae]
MYRLLVQGVTDYAIYLLDADGNVMNWNAGAKQAKGYEAQEIVGRNFDLFYTEIERTRGIPKQNLRMARDSGHFTDEGWRLRKDGTQFWANIVIDAIYDEDGVFVGFAKITRDMTAQRELEHRLAHDAGHDGLTGLSNRTTFFEKLDDELPQIVYGARMAIHYVDLDRFKPVNDSFGHQIGDEVLRVVAKRLRSVAGPKSMVARLGGDEFAVLQFGSPSVENASALAKSIVATLSEPIPVRNAVINIGASVGVAHVPTHGDDAATLVRNADLALYRAKEDGRGCFHIYDESMNAQALSRGVMELKLRQALSACDFELHYQPIVDARSLQTVGYETLLRWRDQTGQQISPAEFVPLAEELGLMPLLGKWVLRTACREAALWDNRLMVAVNVSATQLRDRAFLDVVIQALADSRLPPERLELEITETAVLADPDLAGSILQRLRDIGVSIALDDFGTGFSSLAMVKQLPLTRVKIDRSFVSEIDASCQSRSVIRAVVALCEGYGLTTTAEGVETEEQLAVLQDHGCRDLQGFLFGKAEPASHWRSLGSRELVA